MDYSDILEKFEQLTIHQKSEDDWKKRPGKRRTKSEGDSCTKSVNIDNQIRDDNIATAGDIITPCPDNLSKAPKNKQKEPLNQVIRRLRKNLKQEPGDADLSIKDPYAKAAACGTLIRKPTGVCFDDKMALHECTWDSNYPENPNRYFAVLNRCKELKLLERCHQIGPLRASVDDIIALHTVPHYTKLLTMCKTGNTQDLEKEASKYDAVYFSKDTYDAALRAAGCAINLVKNICLGQIKNGLAIIRPPGHHAMTNEYCGYCFFNNVAVAAQYALKKKYAEKILIIDVDVHHGQATQRMFFDNKNVLYFSIHRYEEGQFWPNLRESNFDFIGSGEGTGYNINIPLNETGLGDSDYLSIILHILLPVAYEFQPNLILISAGYDAAVGCTEGCMTVTPGFYGHLITLLGGLASGKIAVCLEGGYFLPSLAEGVAMTLKSLLGDPVATLKALDKPKDSVITTINNVKFCLKNYWNCFKILDTAEDNNEESGCHQVHLKYLGVPLKPPYETRDCYPVHSPENVQKYTDIINSLQQEYSELGCNQTVTYCYDPIMMLHDDKAHKRQYEKPQRLEAIMKRFTKFHLEARCHLIEGRPVDLEDLRQILEKCYYDLLEKNDFDAIINKCKDLYANKHTKTCLLFAVGALLNVVDSVMTGVGCSGTAIIRPPGHHASSKEAAGFCFINNVAVAAHHLLKKHNLSRILIVDFDVHHGNGTQKIFYKDKRVLYISIHRYDNGSFYPQSDEGDHLHVGSGLGKGYNVNIPFNVDRMGNSEYLTAFHRIILPIAYSFVPQVVLVSAGFDAGINDPLGRYKVSPEIFGHFIQMLKPLANGKLILTLEGGYNTTTLGYSKTICIKTLLNDPLPKLDHETSISSFAHKTFEDVIEVQKKYWPILEVNKTLPTSVSTLTLLKDLNPITIINPSQEHLHNSMGLQKMKIRKTKSFR